MVAITSQLEIIDRWDLCIINIFLVIFQERLFVIAGKLGRMIKKKNTKDEMIAKIKKPRDERGYCPKDVAENISKAKRKV